MISVRKRNIQCRYNSVRHLQRRYLGELPSLRVVSIVTSSVPISLENTKANRTRLRLYVVHLKARYSRQAESDQSSHNSATVNSVGVKYISRRKWAPTYFTFQVKGLRNKSSLNPWIPVRENLLRLADNLRKHADYMKNQLEKTNVAHEIKVCRTDEYKWEIYNPSTINLT